ncbi:MAG: peptidase, imelysin family protein [Oceanospirillaceae bacterium]|nr:peptidase, imelysin family protein [Oceanospirillaceae bacterium]
MVKPLVAALLGATTLLTACGGGSSSDSAVINVANVKKVVDTNAEIAYAVYSDAVDTAVALQTALKNFREDPTQAKLDAARKAWLVAREPYGQSEVYRFRNSPIDSTDYSSEDGPEGMINAWPLGEALIDYVVAGGDFDTDQVGVTANSAGLNDGGSVDADEPNIINTTSIEINAALLAGSASADDEHDVIAGYHAIEFLLWGQDLNDNAAVTYGDDRDDAVKSFGASNLATGGQRPVSDFVPGYGAAEASENVNLTYDDEDLANRRHKFLEVAVQQLIDDLTAVRDGWAPGAAYRTAFTTVNTEAQAKQKLAEILTGMGTLSEGELAGERMQISFTANSQEDEHSCFSDNTHRDIWLDAEGIANSYYGEYAGYDSTLNGVDNVTTRAIVDGYGINDYLADAGLTSLASRLNTALQTTKTAYTAIDAKARAGEPVDVLIMESNFNSLNPMYATIEALNAQAGIIAEVAAALGIDGVVDEEASACDTSNPQATCD